MDTLNISQLNLPEFNPQDLLGKEDIKDINGHPHKIKVKEQIEEGKYLAEVGDGTKEEIVTYKKSWITSTVRTQRESLTTYFCLMISSKPDNILRNFRIFTSIYLFVFSKPII